MPYLTGFLWAAFSFILMRWWPTLFLVTFLLATATVLHGGWLLFGILTAFSGAVASFWLMTPGRRTALMRLLWSPVSLGLLLLVGGVWISFLVNRWTWSSDEYLTVLKNSKTITFGAVIYAAGFCFSTSFARTRMAIWALAGTSGVLALLRVLQMLGFDLTWRLDRWLGTATLGDFHPFAMQNSYASFLVMVLALALFVGLRARRSWRSFLVWCLVLAISPWLLLGTNSRTGIVSYFAVLLTAFLLLRDRSQRRVVLALGILFGVQALLNAQIERPKPVFTAARCVDPHALPMDMLPLVGMKEKRFCPWSSPLSDSRFAIVQRIHVSGELLRKDNVLNLLIRAPKWDRPGGLDIYLDDNLVSHLTNGLENVRSDVFSWVRVPVARELLDGKSWVTVRLQVQGEADQRANYVEVVGGNFATEVVRSTFFNGYSELTRDLSLAPGEQRGSFFIFLNEFWPSTPVQILPPARWAVDNSIMERLVWARVALSNYVNHPVVGSGFGSLTFLAPRYLENEPVFVQFANVHSNFLQLLSECGILGIVGWSTLVVAPIILIVIRLHGRRSPSLLQWFNVSFCGYFLAWALQSLSQYTVTDTRLFHLWLFYLGIWAAQFHRGGYGLALPQFALNRWRWRRVSLPVQSSREGP